MTPPGGKQKSRAQESTYARCPAQGEYHAEQKGRENRQPGGIQHPAASLEQIPAEQPQIVQAENDHHDAAEQLQRPPVGGEQPADGTGQGSHGHEHGGEPRRKAQAAAQSSSGAPLSPTGKSNTF